MEIKVIGLGGIGSALVRPLARYLNFNNARARLTLVDGDSYEPKNQARQVFEDFGNKAAITAHELARDFTAVSVRAIKEYVTMSNVKRIVEEGDVVFLAVDNHATRKLVNDHCFRLSDVALISGGNEFTDGTIQIYLRQGGQNLTPPLTHLHPEIEFPEDRNPADGSCLQLEESSPQLIITNLAVATGMLEAFYALEQGQLNWSESYFDILTGAKRPVLRKEVR